MEYILFIIIGIFSGTLAGLFGIGGGIIIVPSLVTILSSLPQYENINAMQVTIATSLGVIACTSISSVAAHHRKGNIKFSIAKRIFPFIMLGVVTGSNIAYLINKSVLSLIFGVFLTLVSIKMFVGFKGEAHDSDTHIAWYDRLTAIVIGLKSGLLGIGGGIMSVPFLLWKGLPINNAIGTSALFGMIITMTGAISHFSIGYIKTGDFTSGIHLKALILIAPMSMLFAPLGVKLSTILPTKKLKKAFAILILFVAVKMIIKAF